MRTQRTLRLPVPEALEDRSVPSLFGFGGFGHGNTVQAGDARLVQRDFNQFQAAINRDFRTVLYGADSGGNINPTANRAAFNSAVTDALNALAANIARDTNNLAATNPSLTASAIQADLLGTSADTLQAQINNLPTPSGVFTTSARTFRRGLNAAVNAEESQLLQTVRNATTSTATTPPTSTDTTAQAITQARQAFDAFQTAYSNDVLNILYKADASGNINATTNRAAFDAQVATDLATLDTNLHTALSAVPNNTALLSQVDAAVTGTGSDSLRTQLKGLSTPTGAYTLSARLFTFESSVAIGLAKASVTSDIVTATGGTSNVHGFGGFLHHLRRWF